MPRFEATNQHNKTTITLTDDEYHLVMKGLTLLRNELDNTLWKFSDGSGNMTQHQQITLRRKLSCTTQLMHRLPYQRYTALDLRPVEKQLLTDFLISKRSLNQPLGLATALEKTIVYLEESRESDNA